MVRTSGAEEVSWVAGAPRLDGEVVYEPIDPSMAVVGKYGSVKECVPQDIQISGRASLQRRCIVTAGSVSLDSYFMYVKIGSDQQYYDVRAMDAGWVPMNLYAAETDKYIVRQGFDHNDYSGHLEIASDLLGSLALGVDGAGNRHYWYNYTPDFTLEDSNGPIPVGRGGNISKNGRWLVTELYGKGFARVDLQDGYKTEIFSDMTLNYVGVADPWREMAVSDDGRYVALGGQQAPPVVFELDDSCLRSISSDAPLSLEGYEGCPYADIEEVISEVEFYYDTLGLEFGESGLELFFHVAVVGRSMCGEDIGEGVNNCKMWRKIYASNYVSEGSKLDYLALGDSYSSGEGDTERVPGTNLKWYRAWTDNEERAAFNQPREKCHVSIRSYPYKLAQLMELPRGSWNTIACSGAKTGDVMWSGKYSGQGKGGGILSDGGTPRLRGYDVDTFQATALNEFIPGRHQQIEFVRQYKPKIITLTIGGNDVGFADKLTSCAMPSLRNSTCRIATEQGKAALAKEIRDSFDRLKPFYQRLYNASGKTAKIYVLGYPQFINGGSSVQCGANIGFLNESERRTIEASVTYLNTVIKTAAESAGVKYIDIENSLEGGRLCDAGQQYMTGATALGSNEIQESFHPNARGHNRIAMRVWNQVGEKSLLDYDICPDSSRNICPNPSATKGSILIPPHFQVPEPAYAIQYADDLASGSGVKNTLLNIIRTAYSFAPGGTVEVVLFSDPVSLGQYSVESNGSLDIDVQIPHSVPAGYHTLVVKGETPSGEEIHYEQIILVKGGDPNDIDEDSTPDDQQPCGPFMAVSGVDEDLDGIDDACDPEIAEAPEVYRGRLDSANRIYIERNVRVSALTGVEADDDPDEDGWAIVGVSSEDQLIGVDVRAEGAVDFEVLGDGLVANPHDPVLYVYDQNQKCTAYRPANLGAVAAGEARSLVHARISNEKCYQDLSSYPEDPEEEVPGTEDPPVDDNEPPATPQTFLQVIASVTRAIVDIIVNKLQALLAVLRRR